MITVKHFLLKKFPTKDYMDCPVPKHYWEVMQEYAEAYHADKAATNKPMIKTKTPEDYYTFEFDCEKCGLEIKGSDWGECENIEEAIDDVFMRIKDRN